MEKFSFIGFIFSMFKMYYSIERIIKALKISFIFLFILSSHILFSQDIVKVVTLEGVTIQAVEDDFDTEAFIEKVRSDSTFYLAFKAMNYYSANYNGWLKVFKKGEKEKGFVIRSAKRYRKDDWMWVEIKNEDIQGKIQKKNGEYKYLTAETWDEVFFPHSKQKVSMNMSRDFDKEKDQSSAEKHRQEVKQMMFNPGNEVEGIPLIGKKMGIFEPEMHQYYNYSVYTAQYKDSIRCLVFDVEAKPDFRDGKTVIKSLTTYFDQETFNVMQREVNLQYNSLLIDFEIYIKVDNEIVKDVLLPEMIYYQGYFDVPFMKKELVEFKLNDFDYLF